MLQKIRLIAKELGKMTTLPSTILLIYSAKKPDEKTSSRPATEIRLQYK